MLLFSCEILVEVFRARNPKVWGSIPHGTSEFFHSLTLVTGRKKILFYFFTELKTHRLSRSIYKHYAIDIADPNSIQDACYMNFVIDLAHRRVSVAQW